MTTYPPLVVCRNIEYTGNVGNVRNVSEDRRTQNSMNMSYRPSNIEESDTKNARRDTERAVVDPN